MNGYISANDYLGGNDSESIQNAIAAAKREGTNRVIIPKENKRTGEEKWVIGKTVALPSDIEIFIDGAYLVLADETFINMFATENYIANEKFEEKNIKIHGANGATLDGGKYNGLSEYNSRKNGNPHIRVNSTMIFYNTDGLSVCDLKIINQRWWAVLNLFVCHAEYRNIDFKADLSRIDKDGVHYPNELPRSYDEIYVKNADGIDLRVGCHDFTIENITGFTEDDTVALTALSGFEKDYLIEGKSTDIHSVVIRNIHTDCYICSMVRLLCADGNKVHGVLIDGIEDMRTCKDYISISSVRIGDNVYGKVDSKLGDMHNIEVKNVSSKARQAVSLCRTLKDSRIEGIKNVDGRPGFAVLANAEFENVVVKY